VSTCRVSKIFKLKKRWEHFEKWNTLHTTARTACCFLECTAITFCFKT
jgi:hypothetical protein